MFETVEEALEALGPEARNAYLGNADTPWEERPECVDMHDAVWYEWCDDCETFHRCHYLFGYEVTEGHVELLVWCCDEDGNWDISDAAYVGTQEAKALADCYGPERWEQHYANYLRHVAETGEDPCGEFLLPPSDHKKEMWEIHVTERGERVWVVKAGELGSDAYQRPEDLPNYVQEYLLLEKLGDVSAFAIDPDNIRCIADIGEDVRWEAGRHRGEWVTTVEIVRSVPSMTDEEWSAVLRVKANKARAGLLFGRP